METEHLIERLEYTDVEKHHKEGFLAAEKFLSETLKELHSGVSELASTPVAEGTFYVDLMEHPLSGGTARSEQARGVTGHLLYRPTQRTIGNLGPEKVAGGTNVPSRFGSADRPIPNDLSHRYQRIPAVL